MRVLDKDVEILDKEVKRWHVRLVRELLPNGAEPYSIDSTRDKNLFFSLPERLIVLYYYNDEKRRSIMAIPKARGHRDTYNCRRLDKRLAQFAKMLSELYGVENPILEIKVHPKVYSASRTEGIKETKHIKMIRGEDEDE